MPDEPEPTVPIEKTKVAVPGEKGNEKAPETPKKSDEITALERARTTIWIEYMFIIVAALMFTLIYYLKGRSLQDIIALPEWSVCSVIMSGILITKFVAILGRRPVKAGEPFSLMAAIVLICVFIPSIIVLSMIILLEPAPVSTVIINAQMILFGLASASFLALGTAFTEMELEDPKE